MTRDPGVALERANADLVVANGRVLLPDGTLRRRAVAVAGDRIAAVPADADPVTGPDTTVVDATGRTVVPGLIDAHDHLDLYAVFERGYHRWLERGVTGVVTELSSMGATGVAGVEAFLAATAGLPVTAYPTVPPQSLVDVFGDEDVGTDTSDPDDDGGRDSDPVEPLATLFARDRVVGVGEIDWVHVLGRATPELDRLYERAREAGGRIVGHGAGLRDGKLAAFAGVVDDDHEPTRPEGVQERLRAGLHVVGRRGSIRDDLDAVVAADRPRGDVSLCTDGTWPGDDAGMDDVVRTCIDRGIDPVEAVEMATRNPAKHFGLDGGAIAPGSRADVVVLEDLPSFDVDRVIAGGSVVVEDGTATVGPRPHDYPEDIRETVAVAVEPDDLRVPTEDRRGGAVRAIDRDRGLVTRERTVEPPTENGAFQPAPDRGVLKVALFDRRPDRDRGFVGFVTGLGIDRGAVATTFTWERPGLIAVGASDAAIRRAIDRVVAMGGGWAVVDSEVLATLPTPIAGVCADAPRSTVAAGFDAVDSALQKLGARPDPGFPRANEGDGGPILGIQTLGFPGVPALKMGFSGYLDVMGRRVVGLDPEP